MAIDPDLLTGAVPDSVMRAEELANPALKTAYHELDSRYSLINAVLAARLARGWTQKDLAAACGSSQSSIARFESGLHEPRWTSVVNICKALDLPLTLGSDQLAG